MKKETEASTRLSELELRQAGLEELIATIKDGKGAQKIVEWHRKMEECQLSEMKAKRQLTLLEHQVYALPLCNVVFTLNLSENF